MVQLTCVRLSVSLSRVVEYSFAASSACCIAFDRLGGVIVLVRARTMTLQDRAHLYRYPQSPGSTG